MSEIRKKFDDGNKVCPNPNCETVLFGFAAHSEDHETPKDGTPTVCGCCGELIILKKTSSESYDLVRGTTDDLDGLNLESQIAMSAMQAKIHGPQTPGYDFI